MRHIIGVSSVCRRLFTVGVHDTGHFTASDFFRRVDQCRRKPSTVKDAIKWLKDRDSGTVVDHEWSKLRTIEKYSERYRTGQFGWRKLEWSKSAPSFGSIAKTYILHPDAGDDAGFPLRVLSVREVLSIMGFDREFRFPEGTPLHLRYRMVANPVSQLVAMACAQATRLVLRNDVVTAERHTYGTAPTA